MNIAKPKNNKVYWFIRRVNRRCCTTVHGRRSLSPLAVHIILCFSNIISMERLLRCHMRGIIPLSMMFTNRSYSLRIKWYHHRYRRTMALLLSMFPSPHRVGQRGLGQRMMGRVTMTTATSDFISQCYLTKLIQREHIRQNYFFPLTATRLPIIEGLSTLLRRHLQRFYISNTITTGFLRKLCPIHLSIRGPTWLLPHCHPVRRV